MKETTQTIVKNNGPDWSDLLGGYVCWGPDVSCGPETFTRSMMHTTRQAVVAAPDMAQLG